MNNLPEYQRGDLVGEGATGASLRKSFIFLHHALALLSTHDWRANRLQLEIRSAARRGALGVAAFRNSLVVALGIEDSKKIPFAMVTLGREASLRRVQAAIDALSVVA